VESQRAVHGDSVHWDAFQYVGLPAGDLERYKAAHNLGRQPSRARVLLMGTFKDEVRGWHRSHTMGQTGRRAQYV
jgi:hypothetical protein